MCEVKSINTTIPVQECREHMSTNTLGGEQHFWCRYPKGHDGHHSWYMPDAKYPCSCAHCSET